MFRRTVIFQRFQQIARVTEGFVDSFRLGKEVGLHGAGDDVSACGGNGERQH